MTLKTSSTLKEVLKQGQSIWYDGLISRAEFTRMIEQDGIRGATTNPVIFEKALAGGDYDGDLKVMAAKGINADEIYKSLAIKAVQDVAARRGVPMAQVALAWLLARPGITSPIIGATKPEYLEDAVAALALKLTGEETSELEAPYIPHAVVGFS